MLRATLASFVFAVVLSISSFAAGEEPLQKFAHFCDDMMAVQTMRPPSKYEKTDGPSARPGPSEPIRVADRDSSYCAGCDCSETACKENCAKCR